MNLDWIALNSANIARLTWQHAWTAAVPLLLSVLISIPLGWLAHNSTATRRILLPVTSTLYALPSLPLFVVLPLLLGTQILDVTNVIVALTIYGVALLVRTATDAFDSVGVLVRDDAVAIGHSRGQVFWRVALPLAGPPILAGARVISSSTLSLVSVGALIGIPSLGYFFTNGYQRSFPTEIAVGILGTVLLAIVFDLALQLAGRLLLPWVRLTDRRRP